tara:strand:+ start:657 stop:1148 length:492 start_codon:yes stop_codon:yes gene_type:complete
LINHITDLGRLCPECGYSLKGLNDIEICPECGSKIDFERIATQDVNAVIRTATTWCGLGAIGWIVSAYTWWLMNTIRIPAPMIEEPLDLSEHLDDLASTGVIFSFALYLVILRFRAIKIMYAHAGHTDMPRLQVPRRIIAFAIPGIAFGSLCGLMLLLLIIAS